MQLAQVRLMQAVHGAQAGDLAAEAELAVALQVDERLDAEAVARREEALAPRVPQGEGPHAVEALHAVFAPLFVGVQHDLGVAARGEDVAARAQLGGEFEVVVDLAVEDQPQRAVLIAHGLMPGGTEVVDGEAAKAQGHASVVVLAFIVGAAMLQGLVHCRDVAPRVAPARCRAEDDAVDAAHACQSRALSPASAAHCGPAARAHRARRRPGARPHRRGAV